MRIEQSSRRRRLVSLTPLIDVVFILLIFFMLASTFIDQHTFSVNAPASSSKAAEEDQTQPLRIYVSVEGYRIDDRHVGREAVMERLHKLVAEESEPQVQVIPTKQAPVRAVVQVIDWSAGKGIEDVALIRRDQP